MIQITLTVSNDETKYGRSTVRTLTLDEFEESMSTAPKFPFIGSSLDEFIKIRDFFKETPLKGLLKSMAENMLYDIVTNKDKYLEDEPCTNSQ